MQQEVHNDIRDVFNMPTRSDAEIQLKKLIEKYGKTAPDLSNWLENELPEGFTVFNVEPDSLNARRKLRTTNMVEFQNKELKKRTRCIRVFPNKESLLRIATALLIELDENPQKYMESLIEFLLGWLINHILYSDKKIPVQA